MGEDGFPQEDSERNCILCGHCVAVCGFEALTHSGLPSEPFLPMPKNLPDGATLDRFLMSRRSVRAYRNRPVPRETLEALLDVARRAPTATNSQKLHWIVVNGAEKVQTLSAEMANWMRTTGLLPALLQRCESGPDPLLRGAPAVVVACAPEDYDWGKQDCAIALTFLELAAEARGLGACWAGYLTRIAGLHAPLREALGVPEGYAIQGGLMIGEAKHKYKRVPPRKRLSVQWL
jgi:nitroreductase